MIHRKDWKSVLLIKMVGARVAFQGEEMVIEISFIMIRY